MTFEQIVGFLSHPYWWFGLYIMTLIFIGVLYYENKKKEKYTLKKYIKK